MIKNMRKTNFTRFLSGFLACTLMLGSLPMSVFASNDTGPTQLTIEDVNENQSVFSKSYVYEDELKTIYAYNTGRGTCRVTGDIPYAGGTYGNISVRHEDGYLEFPFEIKQIEAITIVNSVGEGQFLLFLDKENNLRSFTNPGSAYIGNTSSSYGDDTPLLFEGTNFYAPDFDDMSEGKYGTVIIEDNVIKLNRNIYLTSEGFLCFYDGIQSIYLEIPSSNVTDFVAVGNDMLRLTFDDGNITYVDLVHLYQQIFKHKPDHYQGNYVHGLLEGMNYKDYLTFNVKPMNFKHTGVFPEQAANWDFIR
jgi:hypothetical protein